MTGAGWAPWSPSSARGTRATLERVIWASQESLKRLTAGLYDIRMESEEYAPTTAARALIALDGFDRYVALVADTELRDRLRDVAQCGRQVDESETVVPTGHVRVHEVRPLLRALRELLDSIVVHDSPSVETPGARVRDRDVGDTVGAASDADAFPSAVPASEAWKTGAATTPSAGQDGPRSPSGRAAGCPSGVAESSLPGSSAAPDRGPTSPIPTPAQVAARAARRPRRASSST